MAIKNFLVALLAAVSAAPADELVPELKGSGPNGTDTLDYTLYSGYIDHTNSSKKIHYMLVQAEKNWENVPLLIWFNGGPGCSSMLAFMQEHGPYVMPNGENTFVKNDYAWNREANVLYIEQPAGVGYSYCDPTNPNDGNCAFDDNNAASDNLKTVLAWYEKYPEFKGHDLYISGESYAGIYVPYLVNSIHNFNQANLRNPDVYKPNLKGMMVGNGVTNWDYDTNPAFFEMSYWHSLISNDLYEAIKEAECDTRTYAPKAPSEKCAALGQQFMEATNNINIYDILGTCWGTTDGNKVNEQIAQPGEMGMSLVGGQLKTYRKAATAADYTPWAKPSWTKLTAKDKLGGGVVPPCTFAQGMLDYLNNQEVRQQLHIPENVQEWFLCSEIQYDSLLIGSQWIWESLKGKYRMLKFSGDTDGAVPTKGTLAWINSLNRPVTQEWRPYFVDKKLAGSVKEWDGITLGIVHGAGHMAPQFKPPETYHLIFNWLKQLPI